MEAAALPLTPAKLPPASGVSLAAYVLALTGEPGHRPAGAWRRRDPCGPDRRVGVSNLDTFSRSGGPWRLCWPSRPSPAAPACQLRGGGSTPGRSPAKRPGRSLAALSGPEDARGTKETSGSSSGPLVALLALQTVPGYGESSRAVYIFLGGITACAL